MADVFQSGHVPAWDDGMAMLNHLQQLFVQFSARRVAPFSEFRFTYSIVFRISDSAFGVVDEQWRSSVTSGWQMLFGDGLKAFVEAG